MFFLVMVLMAAVVAGTTIGIVSNMGIIIDRVNVINSGAAVPDTEIAAEVHNTSPEALKTPAESSSEPAAASAYCTETTSDLMVVTGEEKEQIIAMLQQLGMPVGGDYNQFIKDFQQQQSLPATGSLDSRTLRIIINKTTQQRAQQAL